MSAASTAVIIATLFIASLSQRVTGMGFALIATPLSTLVLGANMGVGLVLALGLISTLIVWLQLWNRVAWRRLAAITAMGLVGAVPGWWASRNLGEPVLAIVVGGMIVVALVMVIWGGVMARLLQGTPGLLGAGLASGFMGTTAAVAGPALAAYALASDWDHEEFVATAQPYFTLLNVVALPAHAIPALPVWLWLAGALSVVTGTLAGTGLGRHIHASLARRLILWIALLGACSTITKGVLTLPMG